MTPGQQAYEAWKAIAIAAEGPNSTYSRCEWRLEARWRQQAWERAAIAWSAAGVVEPAALRAQRDRLALELEAARNTISNFYRSDAAYEREKDRLSNEVEKLKAANAKLQRQIDAEKPFRKPSRVTPQHGSYRQVNHIPLTQADIYARDCPDDSPLTVMPPEDQATAEALKTLMDEWPTVNEIETIGRRNSHRQAR